MFSDNQLDRNAAQRVCGAALLALAATASAQETNLPATNAVPQALPEVMIIGESPKVPQQQGSIALSTVPGSAFNPGGMMETRDLIGLVPNTTIFDGNNQRTPRFSVRGFRENNFLIGEPTVTLYLDDVPYTDLTTRGLPLYGIERADMLRGPQGTLYGASGPGGVLDIHSVQPGPAWHGQGTAGYGNYNSLSLDAGISGPAVKDELFVGAAGLFGSREGFVENLSTGSHPDTRETLSGRASVRWTPAERWDISASVFADRFRDGFVPTYLPGSDESWFKVRRNDGGYVHTDNFGQALRAAYNAPDFKVLSVTSHRDWQQELLQDFDFSPAALRNGFSNPTVESWTQELRAQSADDQARLRWLGGLFFGDNRNTTDSGSQELYPLDLSRPPLPPGTFVAQSPSTFQTTATGRGQTYAAFGQATYEAVEKLDVIGGIRYSYDDRSVDRRKTLSSPGSTYFGFPAGPLDQTLSAYEEKAHFDRWQPKAGLAYHFTKQTEAYFSFSGGYQSGGFNVNLDKESESRYSPMHSWNYELGMKSSCWEDKLAFNAALFVNDIYDYQVYRLNPADPTQAYLQNAERASSMGAEAEITARPLAGLDLSGSFGYAHSRYDRYHDPINNQDFDGNKISFTPQFTANLAAQYRLRCGFFARVEVQGIGDYSLTEDNARSQEAFALLHARLGYERANWSVCVFGRNLLDERYASNALDLRNTAAPGQANMLVLQPGDPLTFGVAFTGKF